jgi:hypothetical protein
MRSLFPSLVVLAFLGSSQCALAQSGVKETDLELDELVMSEDNLKRTEEKLKALEQEVLDQLSDPAKKAVDAPKVQAVKAEEKQTPKVVAPAPVVEPVKAVEGKPQQPLKSKESEVVVTMDTGTSALKELGKHPAIEKVSSEKKIVRRVVKPTAVETGASDQRLLIAESQVEILSKELDTTRQSLRSAERRIDELSALVRSTYTEDSKRSTNLFAGDGPVEHSPVPAEPVLDAGARASLRSDRSYPDAHVPMSDSWNAASGAEIATVVADRTPMRVAPNRNENVMFSLSRRQQVRIELRAGEWFRVITPDGSRGWLQGQHLVFGNVEGDPNSTVSIKSYNPRYEPEGFRF